MKVLLWHVYGAWTASVKGKLDCLVPVTLDPNRSGLGRARTCSWPDTVAELTLLEEETCGSR